MTTEDAILKAYDMVVDTGGSVKFLVTSDVTVKAYAVGINLIRIDVVKEKK